MKNQAALPLRNETALVLCGGLVALLMPDQAAAQCLPERDTCTVSGTDVETIELGDGDDIFENNGTITNLRLGNGENRFLNNGVVEGYVSGGVNSEIIRNYGSIWGSIDTRNGFGAIENVGRVHGSVSMGSDEDTIRNSPGAVIDGDVNMGAGINSLTNLPGSVVGGSVTSTGSPPEDNKHVGGRAERTYIENRGTIAGGIYVAGGSMSLVNHGTINGPVVLGDGADSVLISQSGKFLAGVTGGAGIDTASIYVTDFREPRLQELDLTNIRDFETLRVGNLLTALSGTAAFAQIDVYNGRLIGRVGSILAGSVTVRGGAAFESAGTVIGTVSIDSGGVLSPGDSVGTMAVQGDVVLSPGSSATFKFSQRASDQLLISGNLILGSETTLNLVGERPLTPGTAYDLIVADGGISGRFSTTSKALTVLGFLRQTENRLQLVGTFEAPVGVARQTRASIDYVNSVLLTNDGGSALYKAIPSLLGPDQTTSAAAFARLTPEAYATAQQLGVEHGLGIIKAGRAVAAASFGDLSAFSFTQAFGNSRKLRNRPVEGISAAQSESYGAMGGVGYGDRSASAGAFVGYLHSQQRVSSLDAKTISDGLFAGFFGHVQGKNFDLNMQFAYDWSEARTSRAVLGATAQSDQYNLYSLISDVSVGYSVPVSASWTLRSAAGITHIRTNRGRLVEAGSSAFGLEVNRARASTTFVDGAVRFEAGLKPVASFRYWLELGVRHQLAGHAMMASGGFEGVTSRFSVAGAARSRTLATAGAGASAELMRNLELLGSYFGEFGGDASSNNISLGLRFTF